MTSKNDAHLIVLDGNSGAGKSHTAGLFVSELFKVSFYDPFQYDFVEPAREILARKFNLSFTDAVLIFDNKNTPFPALNNKTYREALFDITNDPTKDKDYISNLWCGHITDMISRLPGIPVIIATGPLNNAELIKNIKNTPSITKVHLIHMTSPDENLSWTGREPITSQNIPKLQVEYTFINPGKNHPKSTALKEMVEQYVYRFIINNDNTIPSPPLPPRKTYQS